MAEETVRYVPQTSSILGYIVRIPGMPRDKHVKHLDLHAQKMIKNAGGTVETVYDVLSQLEI